MPQQPRAQDLSRADQVRLLSGGDFWHTEALSAVGVPAITLTDGPHGIRAQTGTQDAFDASTTAPATCFPTAATLGSTWDEALLREVGVALGREARALGVSVVLGPGLNLKRHPRGGRNFEYLSEDPLLSGRLAAALVNGIQSQGVGACLKHFAANNQETNRFVLDTVVDERTLRELYLTGFEIAVKTSAPWTVMAAYNLLNGEPCTDHRWLLTDLLRTAWGFEGLVMSDWGATNDRVAAVVAGMDLEMPGSAGAFDVDLKKALKQGRLAPEAVTRCAQRVLDLVERAPPQAEGRIDLDEYHALDLVERAPPQAEGRIDLDEHHALARRAAAAGTVLLTNHDMLPLAPSSSVALIGAFAERPRYQGSGSSLVNPTRLVGAHGAFAQRGLKVAYAPGYDAVTAARDPRLIDEAAAIARGADVAVVLVGLPGAWETEAMDREHTALPPQHDALVEAVCAANPNTVVVLLGGSSVQMPWAAAPAAILEAFLGGQAGGEAIVDVLYGDSEPAGRLAETFPVSPDDVAANAWFQGHPRQVEYREGLFVGYRHHLSADVPPLFPFGHGLSYTSFAWSDVAVDRPRLNADEAVEVSLTVTSTGPRAGAEVVQLYVQDRSGVVLRPLRELRDFAKVHLGPGEQTTVRFTLPPRAFAFYDVRRSAWSVPSGEHLIELGRSCVDIVEALSVTVAGGVTSAAEPPSTPPIAHTDAAFAKRLGHPVPSPRPLVPFTRQSTTQEIEHTALGSRFAATLRKAMPFDADAADDPGLEKMMERSVAEMPLRAFALFSNGRLSLGAVDALAALLNRQPSTAARAVARGLLGRLTEALDRRRTRTR